ncbi:MAG TPA: hypothetical protein PKM97_10425 [Bacteroidia bacterium]|nr:hypothetical protein [Bacteroidia bacterium]
MKQSQKRCCALSEQRYNLKAIHNWDGMGTISGALCFIRTKIQFESNSQLGLRGWL